MRRFRWRDLSSSSFFSRRVKRSARRPDRPYVEALEDRLLLTILPFQQNVNGYVGTVDTYLQAAVPNANNSTATVVNVDGFAGIGPVHGLLRFDNIMGNGVNQIPVGSTIASATLQLQVTNSGDSIRLHRMLQGWNGTSSWNSLASGIQANNVEAASAVDATTGFLGTGLVTINVTTSLTAWVGNPAANLGWALLPTGTNGVDFFSAQGTTPPRLVVDFTAPPDVTLPTWTAGVVTASNETNTTVDLAWSGASDNIGVTAYNVYVNGGLNQTVVGTSTTIVGLTPNTTFNFTIAAVDAALNESINGPSTLATTTNAVTPPIGQGFNVNAADLAFILDQVKIAEAHAATISASNPLGTLIGPGPFQIPEGPNAHLQPLGLRTIDGTLNNLLPGQEHFGAAGQPFVRLTAPSYRGAENLTFDPDGPGGQSIGDPTSYAQTTGVVQDSQPRIISNLIVDQTTGNPAAVAAAGPGAVPDPVNDVLFIGNVAPDAGLSASFNNVFVFFGQFFDHGLDLTTKTGSPVFVPLLPDDPLFDPTPGAPNFMVLTRATNDINVPINKTTPFVDQQQTYASHPSMHVFLREYENDASGRPVATGRLLTTPIVGGMGTWTALKAQAADLLGIQLVDQDVFSVPLLATDPYGRFLRGPNGYAQIVLDNGTLLEGDPAANGGLGVLVPANAVSSGHAFLDDIAHHAVPGTWDQDSNPATPRVPQTPDVDPGTADDGLPGTYDDEMLGAHFVAGDGRVNENIGLTSVHHVFHSEHNRLVQHIKNVLLAGDPAVLPEWQLNPGVWNGERLFQTARFVTEMQYQHLVFEEFARTVQPEINVFDAYDATINAAITVEFSQAVYRFGHSMLTEVLARFNDATGVNSNNIDLFDAFLNPLAFFDGGTAGTLTPEEAAGSLFRGLSSQVANEIDPFVTEALRNTLVGLPLDLAALNIARGRDFGVPPLNQARREFFAATNNPALEPYDNWTDFGQNLEIPESLVNYIAAYGTHPTITSATTIAGRRVAADFLLAATTPDSVDFMNGLGIYANVGGVTTTGVDLIDLWVGGLGEKSQPFGGLLGDTMNYVFELQLERLQDGDRFYYLSRTAGMNLLVQLEGNSFSELIGRNTTASNLPALVFSAPDLFFDAAVQGSVPLTPIVDDPNTVAYDERLLLVRETNGTIRFNGAEHVNWAGDDSALPGEGDRIRSGDGDDTINGNGGDDRLEGGSGNDNIIGGLGNDIITDIFGIDDLKGGDGNDAISPGPGLLDLIQGGRGDDFLIGGPDPKTFLGGPGNDFILGGDAIDDTHGDDGDDWIEGGLQGDALEGDTGLPILLGVDVNTPGHDVLNGNEGNDRYFGEGGNDILISGTGVERFLGQFGHDWVTHYNDPQSADSDLLRDVFAVPAPVIFDFDRFNGVEGLSGWNLNDTLRGDHLGAIDQVGHELNAAGIARINGLAALLPPGATSFTGGNIIIGGGGGDILEGRGGNDIIDGDAGLRVQLLAPNPAGPPGATQLVDSMRALQSAVFAGLLNPGDISIVRSILFTSGGIDVAVFSGPRADYDITVNVGSLTVRHARGNGLSLDPALNNGTDTVMNVELLQFTDQTIAAIFFIQTTAAPLAYTENNAATAIDPGLTTSHPNSANYTGATIAITSGFASGQDVLGFVNQNGISGSFNVATGVLTLTGTSSVANYQAALRSVTYVNTSENPTTVNRTVTFTVSSGTQTISAGRTITVTAVNDAPTANNNAYVVSPGATLNANDSTGTVGGTSNDSVLVNDTDPENNSLTTILVTGPAHASGFTLNANGTFTYTHNGNAATSDTFTYRAFDGQAQSNIATVTITINATPPTPTTVSFRNGVNGYSGTADATIRGDLPTFNSGSVTVLETDGTPDLSTLLRWNINSIPVGSTVSSASITFNATNASTQAYEIYNVLRSWIESQVTWNQAANGTNWTTGGAQGTGDRGTTALASFTPSSTGTRTITLNAAGIAIVQAWINSPSSNNGIIIQDYANFNGFSINSREIATVSQRPMLTVTYTPASPLNVDVAATTTAGTLQSGGGSLAELARAAESFWLTSSGQQSDALRALLGRTSIQWADLSGSLLAVASPNGLFIDRDAAGYGWFLDATPWDSSEFDSLGQALAGSAAAGRVDLLSVLIHEFGHILGREHGEGGVMHETLSAGKRTADTSRQFSASALDTVFSEIGATSELSPFPTLQRPASGTWSISELVRRWRGDRSLPKTL